MIFKLLLNSKQLCSHIGRLVVTGQQTIQDYKIWGSQIQQLICATCESEQKIFREVLINERAKTSEEVERTKATSRWDMAPMMMT